MRDESVASVEDTQPLVPYATCWTATHCGYVTDPVVTLTGVLCLRLVLWTGGCVTLTLSHLASLSFKSPKSKIGMQTCPPVALSSSGLSTKAFTLGVSQLDSQGTFLLDLETLWLPGPKHKIALIPLTLGCSKILKINENKQAYPSSLPCAQVSFLVASHPRLITPVPSMRLDSCASVFTVIPRGDMSSFQSMLSKVKPSLLLAGSGMFGT